MTELLDLIDDVMAQAAEMSMLSNRASQADMPHDCDGCGEAKPNVSLYAENDEGDQIWLCDTCNDW